MRKACLEMVYTLAKQDPRVFFLGSDLGAGTLESFRAAMPERFLMEGVSEANLIGLAAGLALEGNLPYVNTIATFLTRRCFEQLVVDLCLHRANVRLLGNGGGLVYAPLGPTHMAIEDLAILRALPHMTVLAPADANEMRRLMLATLAHQGPLYIRLGKGNEPLVTPAAGTFEIGKAYWMRKGSDALLITTGTVLSLALEAAGHLQREGVSTGVLHVPTLKPLDTETLLDALAAVPVVVTLEEHTVVGGLGSAVAELIAETPFHPAKRFKRLGLPDVFPEGYGSQASLMAHYGLTVTRLVAAVMDLITSGVHALWLTSTL
ncbi:MAG: transketolase [Candidatus Tectimicrobiota bacterium]|nr:MAG: transketolase [Candidatus Tectomicrobia bacterium]